MTKYNFPPEILEHVLPPNKLIVAFIIMIGLTGIINQKQYVMNFVKEVLKDIHSYEKVNGRVIGYLYWSLLDNFEWDLGYDINFGLIEVNKLTYERSPHLSAEWFGSVYATNSFTD